MAAIAVFSLVAVLGAGPGAGAEADGTAAIPERLACLARHYRLTPMLEHGAWVAELPGGARVPWSDGRRKTFEQRLNSPDLQDIFLIPYRAGPIRTVEIENEDPGRIRVEPLFVATYGGPSTVAAQQIRVRFLGMPVRVHRKIAPALARVAERIARARQADAGLGRFLRKLAGGFAARKIAGTDRTSAHAFGIAIDLDKSQSDYWRWQKHSPLHWRNRFPQAIVEAFEAEGFIWGGRWFHYDTMHFEYRPELFGPPCREPVSAVSDTGSR
jgi:hypothetical protein